MYENVQYYVAFCCLFLQGKSWSDTNPCDPLSHTVERPSSEFQGFQLLNCSCVLLPITHAWPDLKEVVDALFKIISNDPGHTF